MSSTQGSSVFGPSAGFAKAGKKSLNATAFAEKIVYYSPPDGISADNLRLLSMYIVFCGTSKSVRLTNWKTWIVTYVGMVSPGLARTFPPATFVKTPISPVALTSIARSMEALDTSFDSGDRSQITAATLAVASLNDLPLLPKMHETIDYAETAGEWVNKAIICHYSVVLFLAGKQVKIEDRSQITVARPKALRNKAHLGDSISILDGGARLSDEAHIALNNAWSEMGQLKAIVFMEYAEYSSAEADGMQEIIWTSMHLLRFSGFAHAAISSSFLTAYPWAIDVPSLRASVGVFSNSVEEAKKLDPKLLPFMKLIYGDKASLFPRKEMEPLIACATAVLTETSSTLSDFYTNNAFNPIVNAFLDEKERRENIRNLTTQKAEKELMDYFGEEEEIDEPSV